jgi:RND family efflux transporter MFP subunit
MSITITLCLRRVAVLGVLLSAMWTVASAAQGGPSARVRLTAVNMQSLKETATAYGHVQPDPDRVSGVTIPRAGLIGQLWVRTGQRVSAGQQLLELVTAPKSRMEYQQAQAAVEFARSQVQRLQRLIKEQMATREQLGNAERDLHDAQAQLKAQSKLGAGRAPVDSIVTQVSVNQGQRVQADTTALLLARRDALLVPLGVEPEVAARITPGQSVTLTSVFRPDVVIASTVAEVHAMVNPNTRLVDVPVRIPKASASRLVLNESMRGVITLGQEQVLAVPRSAVLRDGKGSYVFVVRDGRARRVDVSEGLKQADMVAVSGELKQGDSVVTMGNYELQDGMAVREERP